MKVTHPVIIQGGMGIGVSSHRLARAVSQAGQLGVVSGTGIWMVMARMLQQGDPTGEIRESLRAVPLPAIAERILKRFYLPGGKPAGQPFRGVPMPRLPMPDYLNELLVAGGFSVVWLAKRGHGGLIGINLLEKIQLCLLPVLYGAMLAGVDYVLMGAGIPVQIAESLDRLARHEPAAYRLHVAGALPNDAYQTEFDPARLSLPGSPPALKRPHFLPIVSTDVLASILLKRSRGRIDGFVVEGHTAGGHNAPPRGAYTPQLGDEPQYGAKDQPDLAKFKALGLPFWLAGSYAHPDRIWEALSQGAQGVQLGSIFALCEESGIAPHLRESALALARAGQLAVKTNGCASPSGYPFKEATLPGTLAEEAVYAQRERNCDIGCLRELYRLPNGKLGYRCPAEPLQDYLKKGGKASDTLGKRCLCNALCATIGLGQQKHDFIEPALLTLGKDLSFLAHLPPRYTALDALGYLLGD